MFIFWQTSEPRVIHARLWSPDKYITRYPAQLTPRGTPMIFNNIDVDIILVLEDDGRSN